MGDAKLSEDAGDTEDLSGMSDHDFIQCVRMMATLNEQAHGTPGVFDEVVSRMRALRGENERLREALRDANRRARRALGGDYHYKQTLKVICRKTSEAAESTLTDSEEAGDGD